MISCISVVVAVWRLFVPFCDICLLFSIAISSTETWLRNTAEKYMHVPYYYELKIWAIQSLLLWNYCISTVEFYELSFISILKYCTDKSWHCCVSLCKLKKVTQNLLAGNPIRFGKNPKSPGLLRIKIVKHLWKSRADITKSSFEICHFRFDQNKNSLFMCMWFHV